MSERPGPGPTLPGTYRVADGSPVAFPVAVSAWTSIARDELIMTARHYRGLVTYGEMAKRVQEVSGTRTRSLIANWIGDVLEAVARQARDNDEPPLTALCVHSDGTIGPGYAKAPKFAGASRNADIEIAAAEDRLTCYRTFAHDLPEDGGEPWLTRQEIERRSRRRPTPERSRPVCPTCFTELPATLVCDNCT